HILIFLFFILLIPPPPRSTLFPYTTLFRSASLLSQGRMENRLRTTLTHEYGHVHFHQFMFDDVQIQSSSLFPHQEKSHTNKCRRDRKSTRLNSSHVAISYAVFCLKKKKKKN